MDNKEKAKKPVYKRAWFWVIIAVLVLAAFSGIGNDDADDTDTIAETSTTASEVADTSEKSEEEVEEATAYEWDAGELAYLGLTRSELLEIYNAYYDEILATDTSTLDSDAYVAYEEECAETVASEYGITADDVTNIVIYGSDINYFADFDVDTVTLEHGDLVSILVNRGVVVVKAKITSSYSNEATIDQNYFNIQDLVLDQGISDYDELQYWAVADMRDGSEQKCISFTVSRSMIERILSDEYFVPSEYGEYVDDLWILPSLTE